MGAISSASPLRRRHGIKSGPAPTPYWHLDYWGVSQPPL